MNKYQQLSDHLRTTPQTWLVTGVAGFIGSNLLEALLKLDQRVTGFDNFATGHRKNLDEVKELCACLQHRRYRFYCHSIMRDVEFWGLKPVALKQPPDLPSPKTHGISVHPEPSGDFDLVASFFCEPFPNRP